jgi:anti-sigma factor RsiW
MTCQEFVELVTAYLEGALSERERTAFDEHLALCEGCERYFDQVRQTVQLLGELPAETLPEPARDELLRVFADWRSA